MTPMGAKRRAGRPSPLLALLFAYLLVVMQVSAVSALMTPGHAAHDSLGRSLCSSSTSSPHDGTDTGRPDCDCCLFGCVMDAGLLPSALGLSWLPRLIPLRLAAGRRNGLQPPRWELTANGPRGPPAVAL